MRTLRASLSQLCRHLAVDKVSTTAATSRAMTAKHTCARWLPWRRAWPLRRPRPGWHAMQGTRSKARVHVSGGQLTRMHVSRVHMAAAREERHRRRHPVVLLWVLLLRQRRCHRAHHGGRGRPQPRRSQPGRPPVLLRLLLLLKVVLRHCSS